MERLSFFKAGPSRTFFPIWRGRSSWRQTYVIQPIWQGMSVHSSHSLPAGKCLRCSAKKEIGGRDTRPPIPALAFELILFE